MVAFGNKIGPSAEKPFGLGGCRRFDASSRGLLRSQLMFLTFGQKEQPFGCTALRALGGCRRFDACSRLRALRTY